jgi:hypothetical protein
MTAAKAMMRGDALLMEYPLLIFNNVIQKSFQERMINREGKTVPACCPNGRNRADVLSPNVATWLLAAASAAREECETR